MIRNNREYREKELIILSKTLMIVDDSRIVHAKMKQLLEGSDFEIIGFCRTGEDAIQSYRAYRPDLVTMDIVMPGMDGLEAAKAIIGEFPDANIGMVSSLASDDTMDTAEEIGAKGFVFKPFEKDDLLKVLNDAVKDVPDAE